MVKKEEQCGLNINKEALLPIIDEQRLAGQDTKISS